MTQLTHKEIEKLGFDGDWTLGYNKGNVRITVIEDDDTLDTFFVSVGGIKMGKVSTVERLNEILENEKR